MEVGHLTMGIGEYGYRKWDVAKIKIQRKAILQNW